MSKTIYKYPLDVVDHQSITLPFGAQILCVQTQNNIPVIYAIVDRDSTLTEQRHFRTFGTGHTIDSKYADYYIGTYQLNGGRLVFHVFGAAV